jgi:hypothetical protein
MEVDQETGSSLNEDVLYDTKIYNCLVWSPRQRGDRGELIHTAWHKSTAAKIQDTRVTMRNTMHNVTGICQFHKSVANFTRFNVCVCVCVCV